MFTFFQVFLCLFNFGNKTWVELFAAANSKKALWDIFKAQTEKACSLVIYVTPLYILCNPSFNLEGGGVQHNYHGNASHYKMHL